MINIYCDESCHLEHDGINVMILGAVWIEKDKTPKINKELRDIKKRNGLPPHVELKWSKASSSMEKLYLEVVDYFFDNNDLHFRGLLIPNKSILDHKKYNQSHDDWYYKMFYNMLKTLFGPRNEYNVYIDIKDTNSHRKAQKLHEVCCNDIYDFDKNIIKKIQPIRSHEVQLMQISDILIGSIGYENRYFNDYKQSETKRNIVERIKQRTSYSLRKSTLYREDKFNLFVWHSNE